MQDLSRYRSRFCQCLCGFWLLYAVGGVLLMNWHAVMRFGMRLCS